jgi:hypothetical protein
LDPKLVKIIGTNVTHEVAFRPSPEDVALVAAGLPVTSRDQRGARHALQDEIAHLATREFLFWARGQAHAQLLRSPLLDLDALRTIAAATAPTLRERLTTGVLPAADVATTTMPIDDVEPARPTISSMSLTANDDGLGIG